jgi:hypothetical protein
MVKQKAEVIASDDVTGNYKIKAGRTTLTGYYDSQKMMSAIEIQGVTKYSDLELLRFMQRTNLDYVGVIRRVDEIVLIDTINALLYLARIGLIDRITLLDTLTYLAHIGLIDELTYLAHVGVIDTITNILHATIDEIVKISSMPSITATLNFIQNGDFSTGNLNGWIVAGATYDSGAAKLVAGSAIEQIMQPHLASRLIFVMNCKSALAHANNLSITLFFSDGTTKSYDSTQAAGGFHTYILQPTDAKRVVYIQFFSLDATDTIWLKNINCIQIDDDAFGSLREQLYTAGVAYDARQIRALLESDIATVIPKAKGPTVFRRDGVSNGSLDSYTVPATKTLYLTKLLHTLSGTAGAGQLQINGIGYLDTNLGAAGQEVVDGTPNAPTPFAAGTVFSIVSSAVTVTAYISLMGWLE